MKRTLASEKPAMKTLINAIDKNGPATMDDLRKLLPMSDTVISRACKNGQDDGYLIRKLVKRAGTCGRRHWTYQRTAKPYVAPQVSAKTLLNRAYLERVKQRAEGPVIEPFRHWQDVALFGEPKPCESKAAQGRIYRQPMLVTDDELEAA